MFPVANFATFLRTSFDRIPANDCFFLFFSEFSLSFSEHFFYRAHLGNCLFHVQAVEFQPADADTVKNYFTGSF